MESKRRKYNNGRRHSLATQEKSRELRKRPMSYKNIASALHVAKSTIRLWTKDIILTQAQKAQLKVVKQEKIHHWNVKERKLLGKRLAPFQYRKKYTKKKLIKEIKFFVKKNGRIPLKREFNSRRAFRIYFGSWNASILAAGFDPNPVLFAKRVVATDGHVCDSVAEKIIDDWLYVNDIIHERNVSYVGTKMTADFKIGDIYVEYFGLEGVNKRYNILMQRKRAFCKKRNIMLFEIYPKQLFSKNFLQQLLITLKEIPGRSI